jgi:hypothetical protein
VTTFYDNEYLAYRSLRTHLKQYYYQGSLARIMGFPKTDNPYQGQYKERFVNVLPSQKQCRAEWNKGYEDQDLVLADYKEKTE